MKMTKEKRYNRLDYFLDSIEKYETDKFDMISIHVNDTSTSKQLNINEEFIEVMIEKIKQLFNILKPNGQIVILTNFCYALKLYEGGIINGETLIVNNSDPELDRVLDSLDIEDYFYVDEDEQNTTIDTLITISTYGITTLQRYEQMQVGFEPAQSLSFAKVVKDLLYYWTLEDDALQNAIDPDMGKFYDTTVAADIRNSISKDMLDKLYFYYVRQWDCDEKGAPLYSDYEIKNRSPQINFLLLEAKHDALLRYVIQMLVVLPRFIREIDFSKGVTAKNSFEDKNFIPGRDLTEYIDENKDAIIATESKRKYWAEFVN
jgi:hypothetical protein